jgi:hypothetical protein
MSRERLNSADTPAVPEVSEPPSAPIPKHLAWEKGGDAWVERLDADAIVLRSSTPAPPGARLEARLCLDSSVRVLVKSHGSKREPDGTFVLKGRLIDATRKLREQLSELAAVRAREHEPHA